MILLVDDGAATAETERERVDELLESASWGSVVTHLLAKDKVLTLLQNLADLLIFYFGYHIVKGVEGYPARQEVLAEHQNFD